MSNSNGTQAVDRAARLLSEVVHAADPVTFTEFAAVTGLAKSTTSRLLLALERNHLVRRDDHGRFLPGEMFVSFAWRGGADTCLVAVAQPFLDRLAKATGETINLGVAAGDHRRADRPGRLRLPDRRHQLGRAVGAAARVRARQGAARLRRGQAAKGPLAAVHGPDDHRESSLRADLATVRARGYAVTDEELERGLIAFAGPVFRYDGTVVAAMSVSAPTSRMTREAVTNAARRCVDEAAGLSSALGYRPRPRPGTAKTRARRVADRA